MKWIVFCTLFALTTLPCIASGDMVSDEKESLRLRYEEKGRKCADLKGAGNRASCSTKALNDYNAKLSLLSENPDLYFENKYGNPGTNSKRNDSAGSNKHNGNAVINGEWDNQGRHYSPAGGGNAWRDDGTFMQKAAGGYIDTKTGQFVPAN